jgi:hypothetical protein
MKLHLQATPGELIEKGEQLIQSIGDILRPLSPDLADALAKALPQKENELKFPVLVELQKKTEAEYARQMELMLRDINKVLNDGLKKSALFIGPRGGRWADSEHTIPYDDDAESKQKSKPEEPKHRYGVPLRPINLGTVPRDYSAVEKHPKFKHGVAVYDKPLTSEQIRNFELEPILTPAEIDKRVDGIAQAVDAYKDSYLKMIDKEPDYFRQMVADQFRKQGPGHVDDFGELVKDRKSVV